ncbi:Indole-3-glycerol phosphate synthase [uncultured Desulfobacterium sp.]|uniref:Indole-3-glycerol phosphate synthase n=1 Tax=uncultured Desulfobacterium sp. TaxID=201089 RepID=A0A445N3M5_9BACT|nr:Indole-3-glycerol phosphate synthase [uncultured Desulfobacterium sp.]
MHSRLIEILDEKRREVQRLKAQGLPTMGTKYDGREIRDFKKAISTPDGTQLIAEIKFASPSAGIIREGTDPIAIGRMYEQSGAAAISLLTDEKFFGGNIKNLPLLKEAVRIPILRKDFIIDEIQIKESLLYGADAILLIVRILERQRLVGLLSAARESGLGVLTEIHDRSELEVAIDSGAQIIGINNRDLDTFSVDIATTLEIAPMVPKDRVVVSESGIFTAEDINLVKGSGVNAVLVGTSIMKSDDPGQKVKELVVAGKRIE